MLTATETIQQQKFGLFDRDISINRSEKVYYSPELDSEGHVYYVPITEQQVAEEVARTKRKGNIKTYTINEVRQKLSDMMHRADEEFNRGDYITEKEMWAEMGELRAGIPRE